MKITLCTHDAPSFTGGPNSWLRRILPDFRAAGIDCEVLFFIDTASPDNCPCWQDLRAKGFECKALCGSRSLFAQVRWLLSQVAIEPPDVFVTNLSAAGLYAGRWLKDAGIPTVGILHSDDEYYRTALQKFVFGNASERLSTVVCVSDFLEQYVHSFGDTPTSIECIPYGVPIPERHAAPPTDTLKLIYVGRLVEEQKQISAVTEGLCQVLQAVPNTEATIFGNGPDKRNVISILEKADSNLPISLGGQIDNAQIQQVMLDSHVLVLLSDYEGLPIALMEAMACGLVPICLDIRSGIPELIQHGSTGLLVQDRRDDFVRAVKSIREDSQLWEKISQGARTKILEKYAHTACTKQWVTLLQQMRPETKDVETIRKKLHRGYRVLHYLNEKLSAEALSSPSSGLQGTSTGESLTSASPRRNPSPQISAK